MVASEIDPLDDFLEWHGFVLVLVRWNLDIHFRIVWNAKIGIEQSRPVFETAKRHGIHSYEQRVPARNPGPPACGHVFRDCLGDEDMLTDRT